MIGNGVIPEVDAFKCVILSKAEKHMPYGELVGTTECIMLWPRCCTDQGRYNRVQLHLLHQA
jgi:hypothetical protein